MGQRRKESRKVKKEEKKAPPPVRKTVPPEFKVKSNVYIMFYLLAVSVVTLNFKLQLKAKL